MSANATNPVKKLRIVHYLNQFFGGLGAEEQANIAPLLLEGAKGPGRLLEKIFKDQSINVEIVATVICGDTYFAENQEKALREIIPAIRGHRPDLVIAGPAFNAGRYGMACGAICSALNQLGLTAITAMYKENPGVDQYRKSSLIVECADNVSGMEAAVKKMVLLGQKILKGEEIEFPKAEGCFEQGIRKNYFHTEPAYRRAIKMLLQKINGEPFTTEYPIPCFDRVEPQPALADLKGIKIALVTSGGVVPTGNPDHIESSSASKYGKYSLSGIEKLESQTHQSAHGGYDNTYANKDPNRVLPLDMMRELEKELGFKLYEWYYATVGNGTSVDNAQKFAKEIATELLRDGVKAVILTSTWGTCTRCGATMAKEIERTGIPVVHICSIITISQTVGANRIIPAIAIPHPLGNPKVSLAEEKELRRNLLKKAFKALQTPIEAQTVFSD